MIRNVVFDIGQVFVHLNDRPFRGLLTERGVENSDLKAAAKARGWHGIVHSGYDSTLAELRALAVEC